MEEEIPPSRWCWKLKLYRSIIDDILGGLLPGELYVHAIHSMVDIRMGHTIPNSWKSGGLRSDGNVWTGRFEWLLGRAANISFVDYMYE